MIWQFLLAAGSIFGIWMVSKNERAGWGWCAMMEVPWTIWEVSVEAWGFMILCWLYFGIYTHNLVRANDRNRNTGSSSSNFVNSGTVDGDAAALSIYGSRYATIHNRITSNFRIRKKDFPKEKK